MTDILWMSRGVIPQSIDCPYLIRSAHRQSFLFNRPNHPLWLTPTSSPPTTSKSHLMPIPPIVDHLLNEIDELKEALATEVERGRKQKEEVDALRKEVGELKAVSATVTMGRPEFMAYALLGKKVCDAMNIAESLVG
ncbi:hypothetical protein D9611_012618 [Ephemerocybe angulata]|uniref:Uncharacterized protein n=1 Tax=Ephemerocybe angulata TaxID=980116 RepID=A0A8H5AW96_9AGAR|nr:hypothetical protein D9611_012618 [Tulosesus angulatus]